MTDAVRAILDQTESDMRALNLWDYRLKSVQAGNVQRLITDIRAALSEQPAIDMDELRRAVCLIGTVGTIDGHDVIRRNSALEIIDARIDRANS